MSFWEVSIFFQGGPDVNKKAHMTLFSCSRWKRENAAEDFLLGRNPWYPNVFLVLLLNFSEKNGSEHVWFQWKQSFPDTEVQSIHTIMRICQTGWTTVLSKEQGKSFQKLTSHEGMGTFGKYPQDRKKRIFCSSCRRRQSTSSCRRLWQIKSHHPDWHQ